MPCGDEEGHGVNDQVEYKALEELVSILLARAKDVEIVVQGGSRWWVDRTTKLVHPDGNPELKLKKVVLEYEESE